MNDIPTYATTINGMFVQEYKSRESHVCVNILLQVCGGRLHKVIHECNVWGEEYRNCRRMAINTQVQKVCMEGGVGFVDMWLNFVGRYYVFIRDGQVRHYDSKY